MNDLIKEIKKARFIWICGNGGSAATAEHFTTDLVKKGYPAICLNSNVSVMTMIANDYGYKHVFAKQFVAYAAKGDLLILISCSGRSENIVEVLKQAMIKDINYAEFETFGKEPLNYADLENRHLKFAHLVAEHL